MERDPRLAHLPQAIVNCASEIADGAVKPPAVAIEIAVGLRDFLEQEMPEGTAAAMLREVAREMEPKVRSATPGDATELIELADRADQFLRTLQLAGIAETVAITAVHNACVIAVARTRGAAGAVAWLRSVADATEKSGVLVDVVAQSR